MNKKIAFGIAAVLAVFACANVQAADLSNGTAGDPITFTPAEPGGTPDFTFNPSPQVITDGLSQPNGYAFSAVHNSALDQTGGMQYGMAYDSTKVFWTDASDLTAITAVTTSNSSAFPDTDWAN